MNADNWLGSVISAEMREPPEYTHEIAVARLRELGRIVEVTFYRNPGDKEDWGSEMYYYCDCPPSSCGGDCSYGERDQHYYSRAFPRWKGLPERYREIAEFLSRGPEAVQEIDALLATRELGVTVQ